MIHFLTHNLGSNLSNKQSWIILQNIIRSVTSEMIRTLSITELNMKTKLLLFSVAGDDVSMATEETPRLPPPPTTCTGRVRAGHIPEEAVVI